MKQLAVKGVTVLMFITLVSAFVAYRSGLLNIPFIPHSGASTSIHFSPDSAQKRDSNKAILLSSSKVLILAEDQKDSKDTIPAGMKFDSSELKKLEIMSSSKSIFIFSPKSNTDSPAIKKNKK